MENVEALFQHTARLIAMDKKGMPTVGSKAEGISIMGVIFSPDVSFSHLPSLSKKPCNEHFQPICEGRGAPGSCWIAIPQTVQTGP